MARAFRFGMAGVLGILLAIGVRRDGRSAEPHQGSIHKGARGHASEDQEAAASVCDEPWPAGPAAVQVALELLADPEPRVRSDAAASLGRLRSLLAVPCLIPLLRDQDPAVRRAVAQALGAIGDPRALVFLSRAMSGEDDALALAALQAARQIAAAHEIEEAWKPWR